MLHQSTSRSKPQQVLYSLSLPPIVVQAAILGGLAVNLFNCHLNYQNHKYREQSTYQPQQCEIRQVRAGKGGQNGL
jgi:hypothetical protein